MNVVLLPRPVDGNETLSDSQRASNKPAELIKVTQSVEEMMQVFVIRAAVFMGDQRCPYAEEFDGNDFTATHILGHIGDEPAATLRIRYFADFAKIERLAVRREFRKSRMAFKIVRFGIDVCRRKGYRKLYGHAQERLVPFWGRFGFRPMDMPQFEFSDHRYVAIECDLKPDDRRLTMSDDPMVLIRPEGDWDRPGALDHSTARPATNPVDG